MEMIAQAVVDTRDTTRKAADEKGQALSRTVGIASLVGAMLDNEENGLVKEALLGVRGR